MNRQESCRRFFDRWRFSEISPAIHTSTQAWKIIEKDYTLRLSLVAHDWATEHLKAWNAVFAEGRKRGNAAYCGPVLVEMEIADADKRAEGVYRTCCDIWEIQGRTKCRSLFRAIFECCLQPMFSARTDCFHHALELHEKRTGKGIPQGISAIGGHMKREMDRLRSKWNAKLEIASRDSEYQQQRAPEDNARQDRMLTESPPGPLPVNFAPSVENPRSDRTLPSASGLLVTEQVLAAASSFTWKELEGRFRDIQARLTMLETVSAEFTRTEWQSGSVTEEWRIRGNSVWRHEFEHLAVIAARKLGYAQREEAAKYWLGKIRESLRRTGLDKLNSIAWCPTGEGVAGGSSYKTAHFNTERIVEMSAMLCVELMARGALESAVSPSRERVQFVQTDARGAGRKVPKFPVQSRRMSVIFGAIQSKLEGQKYCTALDGRRLRPSDRWIEEGCPDTYGAAYKNPRWRKRIQDEKCRYNKQYRQLTAPERESIIQAEGNARRTRT